MGSKKKQLSSPEIKLARKLQLGSLYEASFATDIKRGNVSVALDSEANREDAWYHPHHRFTNVIKPGKIRRVTNASSFHQGTSRNICLLKRSDFLCNNSALRLCFRETCVALSAEIEATFMQVSVPFQIDASHHIHGVTKFMSTIAIFLVQQIHRVLLATLYGSVLRTTKLPILTLQY